MAANSSNPVNDGLLTALLPQHGLLASLARNDFDLDTRLVMPAVLLLYSLSTIAPSVLTALSIIFNNCTSSVEFDESDSVYHHFTDWITKHRSTIQNTRLIASTSFDEPESDEVESKDGFLNFRQWLIKSNTTFTPATGRHWFRHNGCFFILWRIRREIGTEGTIQQFEYITLACFGRSTAPIKALLRECKRSYLAKQEFTTPIHKPHGNSGSKRWVGLVRRPSRPIDTVVLDKDKKENLLKDINEYLDPATAQWYNSRGIPHRRGYLFYGPPGTGKTSLSFAIAGLFGLNMYCLSLADAQMTEDDLQRLMTMLPPRCIVLLEDVDAAELEKRFVNDKPEAGKEKGGTVSAEDPQQRKISLSGLLNAIDGVASHEGRALVLTTNRLDKLDDALVRPGRVDVKLNFPLATCSQIRDLFSRIYAGREEAGDGKLAEKFSEYFQDGVWSPAKIQGFLLERKKSPKRAVDEVGEWVKREGEKKQAKEQSRKELQAIAAMPL